MNRSIWYIAIIGFITVVILTVCMMFMLKWFGDSPLSKNTKIAVAVRTQYKFESVGADIKTGTQKTLLVIQYETHQDSKFNIAAQNQEMQTVADFAIGKAEAFDRRMIDEIRVKRTEIRGGGCWQRSYVSENTFPNPYRGVNPPPLPK